MKVFTSILFLMINTIVYSQSAKISVDKSTVKFEKTAEGKLLEHYYVISNIGTAPLIISDYKVACPCTKLILPKEPILPGKSFKLKLTFDTNGKYYQQDRSIYLQTNAGKGTFKLRMKVNVIPKEETKG